MKKIFPITLLIFMFLLIIINQVLKPKKYEVLRIISPVEFIVDYNQNGIEDSNELFTIPYLTFTTKLTPAQINLANKLRITKEESIGLGFFAENFAKENLADKKVEIKNNNIFVDNQNYNELLFEKGFSIQKDFKTNPQFYKNLDKIRKMKLVIFNNKSHKYHKLSCKYGLMAHNFQIIPISQVSSDSHPCKFCLNKNEYKKYEHLKSKNKIAYFSEDKIPYIKSPSTNLVCDNIKIFLTDFTKVLKPSNSCNTQICNALVNEINASNSTIDFAIYGYTKIPKIEKALNQAKNRGVKIRFVYDSNKNNSNIYPDTDYLTSIIQSNNHDITNSIMHDKFFIFDNKTVLTGSANISSTDMSGFNSNVVLIVNSERIANIYTQEFEQMYCGKFHNRKKQISDKNTEDFKILFSPKDKGITEEIIPIVNGAKNYIYMPAFLLTHKALTQSLINASNRGVKVKVILDATNTHASYSKLKLLRQHNIQAKTENFAGKLHSKSMIIDDKYTILGSMNFSKSGENENDENLIIIKNSQIAKFYKEFFVYLWQRIPDKWLKLNARAESPDSIGSCSDGIDNDFDGKIDKADDSCKIPIKKSFAKSKK